MNKLITVVALATLSLNAVACDTDSEPGSTPLLAADLIDPDDAEQMAADGIDGAAALAEAVELTVDIDEDPAPLSESQMLHLVDYCFNHSQLYYSGQCANLGYYPVLVPNVCIYMVPDSPMLGYGLWCNEGEQYLHLLG